MLNKFTLKAKILMLGSLIALGLVFLGVVAFMQLREFNSIVSENARLTLQREELSSNVQEASVAFKSQVQEWKNILLRGNDVEKYERYVKGFTKEEEDVQQHLTKAISLLKLLGMSSTAAEQLQKEH